MTAPTHISFAIFICACTGTSQLYAVACGLGALLPDIDHPQSAIGRLFFFLSTPINARFGHRGLIHAFILWIPVIIVSMLAGTTVGVWIGIGALSHIAIDCFNLSGVRALTPFNDKPVVVFKRDWRVKTASVREIIVFLVITAAICLMNYSYTLGGPRKLINLLVRSPKIAVEEYQRAGLKQCRIAGDFRWDDGRIEKVDWLVVGLEDSKLVCWNGQRLVRNHGHGEFLRAILKQSDSDCPIVQVSGFTTVNQPSFFFDGHKWHYIAAGGTAVGTIKTVNCGYPVLKK